MRFEHRGDETIGVSCGHRVPRKPRREGARKLYWCEVCGAWRMSGTRSTGEHGHEELQALAELVHGLDEPIEIRVPHELADYQVRLIEALGGRVVVDPHAPPIR